MWTAMAPHSQGAAALLCTHSHAFSSSSSASILHAHQQVPTTVPRRTFSTKTLLPTTPPVVSKAPQGRRSGAFFSAVICHGSPRKEAPIAAASEEDGEDDLLRRRVVQALLWGAEAAYILWLFLLPYAPGDPVWAISPETVNSLMGLSLNFFFILPVTNSVGIRLIDAPVLHPMSEGLFNFVIGWTFMFAPLLFTDRRRDRYKGSLDVLWGLQMFLTNTFLIPYMAIRLNGTDEDDSTVSNPSKLGLVMTRRSPIVGLIGGGVCLVSTLWAFFARADSNFGDITERLDFLVRYLGSERLAYAFIWDIILYTIFQPWLIGDNLQNVQKDKLGIVNFFRFVPVVGLAVYLLCLNLDEELS